MNDRRPSWDDARSDGAGGHGPTDDLEVLGSLGDGLGDMGLWHTDTPAPGAPLPPFRPSLLLLRTRFLTTLPDGSTATVDVDHMAGRASLYRDDRHLQTSDLPVRFRVGLDHIEVAASRYGMQRVHLVSANGEQRRLDPAPGTPEHWRAQLSRRHPRVARALGAGAVAVLTVNLVVLAPQLLELIASAPPWAGHLPTIPSPVDPPTWVSTALALAAGLAGIERALTWRHHRLLDAETDVIDS